MALNKATLDDLVREGWLSASVDGPLTIYNYTEPCMWDRHWTPETMACRGLVMDEDGEIVARPFVKFFNVGEREETMIENLPAEIPIVSEKLDGSLIIVFWDKRQDRWRAITRGSWTSPQAQWAQKWLDEHAKNWLYDPSHAEITFLFELTAPWNRIVLAYPKEEMTLLGAIATETGQELGYYSARLYAMRLGVESVTCCCRPIADIDLSSGDGSREGYVVRYSNGLRVKMKYDEYKRLHKLMTGLSVNGIWEGLAAGNSSEPHGMPDEFVTWFRQNRDQIQSDFDKVMAEARELFAAIGPHPNRKSYALEYMKHPEVAPLLFKLMDGKDPSDIAWKRVKPTMHYTFQKDANE